MARREVRIPFSEIKDPQQITRRNVEEFKKHGLDIHKNEVDEIIDDTSSRTRIMKIRNVKFFDMGRNKK